MKALFVTILSVFSAMFVRAEEEAQKMDPLLQSIRDTLPKGWSVEYNKEDSYLQIQRDEPVSGSFVMPNLPARTEQERFSMKRLERYFFSFRVMGFVTPAQYQRWAAENAEIQKKAHVIFDDFHGRGLTHKGHRLLPQTDADKATAARYDELMKSKKELPDFYVQKLSLRWVIGSPSQDGYFFLYVENDRIRDECSKVRENVVKLFSKYQEP